MVLCIQTMFSTFCVPVCSSCYTHPVSPRINVSSTFCVAVYLQSTVDIQKLASDTIPGLNLEEELKKHLLPSPPPSPREKRFCDVVLHIGT